MAENFSSLIKNMKINIQQTQWIPSKMNSETDIKTQNTQNFPSQRKFQETLESTKTEWTHDIEEILKTTINSLFIRNFGS